MGVKLRMIPLQKAWVLLIASGLRRVLVLGVGRQTGEK
jgi:hypothetical protein